jgi:hypothetical protein
LLELATPPGKSISRKDGDKTWDVTIPLHLRYLEPSESGYRNTSVPWPVVFWACTAEDGTKMGVNPFDRVNLGWEGLFGPRTMFFQLRPSLSSSSKEVPLSRPSRFVEDISVPVLQTAEGAVSSSRNNQTAQRIELGTVVVIVLGFVWILWKLGLVVRSSGVEGKQQQQQRHPAQASVKRDKDK